MKLRMKSPHSIVLQAFFRGLSWQYWKDYRGNARGHFYGMDLWEEILLNDNLK